MVGIAQYFFNDGVSGQTPTTVADSSGNGNNLPINFDTANAEWASNAEGGYLDVTTGVRTSSVNAGQSALNAIALGAALEGLSAFTIILKTNAVQIGAYPDSPILHIGIGDGGNYDIMVSVADPGQGGMIRFRTGDGGGAGFYGNADTIYAFVFDLANATESDRLRIYKRASGTTNERVTGAPLQDYVAPTAAISGVNDASTFITFMNDATNGDNVQGGLKFAHIDNEALSETAIFGAFDNLAVNDDLDPFAASPVGISAGPTVSNVTYTGFQVDLTVDRDAEIDVVLVASGAGQPTEAAFDAATLGGAATAGVNFQVTPSGMAAGSYDVWARATDTDGNDAYGSEPVVVPVQTPIILNVNGNDELNDDDATVSLAWDNGANGTTGLTVGGTAQTGYTVSNDNNSFANYVRPNALYGAVVNVDVDTGYEVHPVTIMPNEGWSFVTLDATYDAAAPGAITGDIAFEVNDQISYNPVTSNGVNVSIGPNGIPVFDGPNPGSITLNVLDPDDFTLGTEVSINYSVPVIVTGVSNTSPTEGSVIQLTGNSIQSVTCPAGTLQLDPVDANTWNLTIPDPKEFGDRTLEYQTTTVLTVSDGVDTETVNIQIQPAAGAFFGTVATLTNIYDGDVTLAVGDRVYGVFATGSGTATISSGLVEPTEASLFRWWKQDIAGGAVANQWDDTPTDTAVYPIVDAPVFTGPINAPIARVGVPYSFSLASYFSHPSGDPLTYVFANLPDGITQDTNSPSTILGVPTTEGTVNASVTVTDLDADSSGPNVFALRVNQAPQWSAIPAQNVGVNQAIDVDLTTFVTDLDTLTFSVDTLPPGLALNGNRIQGTTTTTGSTTTTVTADDGDLTATATIAWAVTSGPVLVTQIPNQAFVVNDTVNITLASYFNDSDGDALSFSSTQLPTGLVLNPDTGVVSGTVTVVQTLAVTFTATDGNTSTNSNAVTFVVNDQPVFAGPIADQYWEVGQNASLNLALYFSDSNVLFYAVSAGSLPDGISLNQTTGMVTGSPTSEGFGNVTFTATDGSLIAQSNSVAWQTNDAPQLSGSIANVTNSVGNSMSFINLNDYVSDLNTLTFSADALPPGISLDANTGLVTGDFTQGGTFTTVFTADDGFLTTDLAAVTWTINNPPAFTGSIPNLSANTATSVYEDFSSQFSDADGGPLFFTATGLPPGLSINVNTGVITGLATSTGAYAVTITASDGVDQISSNSFTYTVTGGTASNVTTPVTRTITVYETSAGRTAMPNAIVIDSAERLDIAVDWSNVLRTGEVIIDSDFLAPDGPELTINSITNESPKSAGWFAGGAENKNYEIEHTVTTSVGAQYNISFYVICIDQ